MNQEISIINVKPQNFITLDKVKHYLRLEQGDDSDDELLNSLITVAVTYAESYLGYNLSVQEVEQVQSNFSGSKMVLRRRSATKITNVYLWNDVKERKELDTDLYELNHRLNQLELRLPFIARGMAVRYFTGYEDDTEIPEPIKLGILNHISVLYDDRQHAVTPISSLNLYAPYRNIRLS